MNRASTKGINYPSLIRDEIAQWERNQSLRVAQISDKHATKRAVQGKGEGFCYKCHRRWTSVYTHVTINFKSPESLIRYRQRCKKCDVLCKMKMPEDEFRRVTQYAIEIMRRCHLGLNNKPNKDDGTHKKTPPHECYLCEKCNFGLGPCCMAKGKNRDIVCKMPK